MKEQFLKIQAVSNLWSNFEGSLVTYISYEWKGESNIQIIENGLFDFIHRYLLITQKYGIFIPPTLVEKNQDLALLTLDYIKNYVEKEVDFPDRWRSLNYLYHDGKSSVGVIYPSYLFINLGNGIGVVA